MIEEDPFEMVRRIAAPMPVDASAYPVDCAEQGRS
jgi:hypothetical protein